MKTPAGDAADETSRLLAAGDEHRRGGEIDAALDAYRKAADLTEVPAPAVCVRIARAHADAGNVDAARQWLVRTVDGGDDFASWDAAGQLLARIGMAGDAVKRTSRVAVLGSYTTTYLARLLRLVSARRGIDLDVYECGFGLFRQELLDPASGLHAFAPDVVVLAVDARATALPECSDTPDDDVAAEVAQWRTLWSRADALGAATVQHTFVVPPEYALAHLDAELPGSRYRMLQQVNAQLADALPANAHVVDCERLAARFGKDAWADPLWWDRAKLAVSLPATPVLARHTAAVIAGHLGLGRKCLVLDLDNTVWGGVIGEDGVAGLKLGGDAAGDAYLAFQDRVLALKRRGVVLAACSKNDDHVAREPFERHPEMRLKHDDFAAFVANWQSKVDNIKQIAHDLSLGLDALVYVDDNPVERQEVRRFLPDVDVVAIPPQPSLYARALADYPWFETGSFTAEDAQRTTQYRARAQINALERTAESIDDFYRDLHMVAVIRPFDDADLPRVAQLVGKTNQFNLTSRRHDLGALQAMTRDENVVHLSLRLRDRFTDHGLVGVAIAHCDGDVLDVDTWLMSCRVIGRTAERAMLGALARAARARGCTALRGTYVPTAKNGLVRELYPSLGFGLERDADGTTTWTRVIDDDALGGSPFIDVTAEVDRGAA
jgi:FkbH-like protein